jgi:hypothetical protein
VEKLSTLGQLARSTTRRNVVRTAAKLGYAAPLVAASFKLDARGALAAQCPDTYFLVTEVDPDQCCRCTHTLIPPTPATVLPDGRIVCYSPSGRRTAPADCTGVLNVSPV